MSRLPIHGQSSGSNSPLAPDDAAFLGQRTEISTPQFLRAVIEDQREEVAKMIVHDDRLVHSRDASGASAVQLAAYHGLDDMVALLRRSEVPLDYWEAAAVGEVARVLACLEEDPSLLDQVSADGYPALVLAAYLGHAEVVTTLLARGADVALATHNPIQMTALHGACAHRDPQRALAVARPLVEAGAPLESSQAGGFTPLHLAALRGRRDLVELLLAAGASKAASSDLDETPWDLAQSRGHQTLADLLAGADA